MAGDTFLHKYEYLTIVLFNIVAAAIQKFVKVDCITYSIYQTISFNCLILPSAIIA